MGFDLYRIPADHWFAKALSNFANMAGCGCVLAALTLVPVMTWALIRVVLAVT